MTLGPRRAGGCALLARTSCGLLPFRSWLLVTRRRGSLARRTVLTSFRWLRWLRSSRTLALGLQSTGSSDRLPQPRDLRPAGPGFGGGCLSPGGLVACLFLCFLFLDLLRSDVGRGICQFLVRIVRVVAALCLGRLLQRWLSPGQPTGSVAGWHFC
ncbi:uncharacterized protein F5Z01DRAFT_658952 [Emericellopsis atlantica]|uniref:Uncharacterized protein n=1 Tax=Emericellopsis atlantica TaxID=2614577 RepID=A0A9P7ZJ11_9HYPO|nr:uncharacterized protein F5Z01DRAFT_658952 [Emericellopsis atlantica]KAG9252998.1 hypothetical protein F5Z01DRAFT_658952 [Emericellopsis atlantica]